jgi:hypothetical protein
MILYQIMLPMNKLPTLIGSLVIVSEANPTFFTVPVQMKSNASFLTYTNNIQEDRDKHICIRNTADVTVTDLRCHRS